MGRLGTWGTAGNGEGLEPRHESGWLAVRHLLHRPGILASESCVFPGSEDAQSLQTDSGCVPEPAGWWLRSLRARAVCGLLVWFSYL